MEVKIIELSDDIKQASKRIDESFDRMIVMCETILESLKRLEDKVDRM